MTVLDAGARGGAVRYDDDTDLVLAARGGDTDAFGVLFDRWFDRVHDVAYRIVRDREVSAEVAQDVFLVAWTHLNRIEQPASFGGWLLRTARNRALNRLERERRTVAVSDEENVMHSQRDEPDFDPGEAMHRNEQVDLVWAAASALGERDASVLDLHLRHGLGAAELAEALGVTANNAHQLLFRLRKRLAAAVRGWVLWRNGRPACAELVAVLQAAGITAFGPAAVAKIESHSDGCAACLSRREQRLAPEAMFAAVPIIAVAPMVRAQAASALEAAGVPMQGSSAIGTGGTGGQGGQGGSGPDGAHGRPRRRRGRGRHMRTQLLAFAAIVLILAVMAMLADPLGDFEEIGAPSDPTTTTPSSTATSTTTTTAVTTTSTTEPRSTTTTVPPTVTTPPPPPEDPDDTTTEPVADPPVIDGFSVAGLDKQCRGGTTHTATWTTTNATAATIGVVGGPAMDVPPSGTATLCAPIGATFELVATGPGGEDTATATVPIIE
jgi:RNA polymerase sigma factor (sigma-70 family)